jgi:CPA2 family monovalent cation:H+ antiporter-2
VLIGFGHAGQTLARLLRSLDIDFVAVDTNSRSVEEGQGRGLPIVFGDATRPPLLRRLGVDRARLVVVAISDPLATRRIVSRVHALAPDTRVLARTRYIREVDPLTELGAQVVVAEEFEASIELLARALEIFDVPHGSIHNFTAALREEGYGAIRTPAAMPLDPWLVELLDQTDSEWIEVPAAPGEEHSLQGLDIRARTGASVVAIERDGQLTTNPDPSFRLRSGDRLLVLGDGEALSSLSKLLQPGEDTDSR